jgi:hypothetical protein
VNGQNKIKAENAGLIRLLARDSKSAVCNTTITITLHNITMSEEISWDNDGSTSTSYTGVENDAEHTYTVSGLSVIENHMFNFRGSHSDGWHGSWWGIKNACGELIGGGGPDSWITDNVVTFPVHVARASGSFEFGSEQLCCAAAESANDDRFDGNLLEAASAYNSSWQLSDVQSRSPCACDCYGEEAGWEVWDGNTFIGVDMEMDWDAARVYCQTHHHDLASIHSKAENELVVAECRKTRDHEQSDLLHHYCYIGLNDIERENKFKWSDGSSINFEAWAPNEPDNRNAVEDWVTVSDRGDTAGQWIDVGVSSLVSDWKSDTAVGFVCQGSAHRCSGSGACCLNTYRDVSDQCCRTAIASWGPAEAFRDLDGTEAADLRWGVPAATAAIDLDAELSDWDGIEFKAQTPFRPCSSGDSGPGGSTCFSRQLVETVSVEPVSVGFEVVLARVHF